MLNSRKTVPEVLDTLCHLSLLIKGLSIKTEAMTGLPWHHLLTLKLVTLLTPAKTADIAEKMLLDQTSSEALIDSLETEKLVLHTRASDYVELTDKGREILARASVVIEEATEVGQKAMLTEGNALLAAGLQWMMLSFEKKA